MKKTRVFLICAAVLALVCLFLVGCSSEDKISSVSLKDHSPDTVIEIAAGEFNYGAYTLVVSYESERTEEIALTEDMISKADRLKLYQVGDHDITASYGDYKCVFKVSVKRAVFEDLAFPANNVFTYDGKAHTVEVDGTLPANAVVTYLGGNSFVNAGTYDLTAIVSCEGYATQKLSTTVTIERAKYDMSSVKFESKEFVYDGKRIVSVCALKRAANDDINVFASNFCKILIKIEIIAGEKGKSQAFKFQNIWRCDLIAICHIKLMATLGVGFDFAWRGMSFEISADDISVSVNCVGCVSNFALGFESRIDKHERIALFCGFASLLHENVVVFLYCIVKAFFAFHIS